MKKKATLLIQFYRHENLTRVFSGGRLLFEQPNSVRRTVTDLLGIAVQASDWENTEWGSEIELALTVAKPSRK